MRRPRRPRRARSVTVPCLRDLRAYEARAALASADLRMRLVFQTTDDKIKGVVVDQSPAPGQTVRRRSKISVHI